MTRDRTAYVAARTETPLAGLTTLVLGGLATTLTWDDPTVFADVVASIAEPEAPPVCLGWGSNVLASDNSISVPVILVRTQGITVTPGPNDRCVNITVQAGHALPDLVEFATAEGLIGLETLAGVPGTVGAMPIQNVGAYGQETADTLAELTAWDWWQGHQITLSAAECRFGHRTSMFKRSHRWTILAITFTLIRDQLSAPITYSELADHLDVPLGTRLPTADVNGAVIALRRRKGMVLDPTDPDSRSVGSIFLSPTINEDQAETLRAMGASPHTYPDGTTRVGASWLIRQAGYHLGERFGPGIRLSTKHYTLVADEHATAAAFADAAANIRVRTYDTTGVALAFEPDLIGSAPSFSQLSHTIVATS